MTGKELSSVDLERGPEVIASIYIRDLESGNGSEVEISLKLESALQTCIKTLCCHPQSACCKVAESCSIPYLGLSKDFRDLTGPAIVEQIMFWFQETANKGEAIDLYGSIPCGPHPPLNKVQGEEYLEVLASNRAVTETLVDNFCQLGEIAVESGACSVSFEWLLTNEVWKEEQVIQMILHFNMYSCYPSGCGMGLVVGGKHPLVEWRVVTTSKRLASHLDKFKCSHDPGHSHDPTPRGTVAKNPGSHNTKMAVATLSALNPDSAFPNVPVMPVTHGSVAHQERGLLMAQIVLGIVHTPLSRQELFNHPKGRMKTKEEADELRALEVWDNEDIYEPEELRSLAKREGWKVHIAEATPIGSIKNSESKDKAKLKVRLVFRGDDTRDENNQLALFRVLKSIPASIATVNQVLWFGLRQGNMVQLLTQRKHICKHPFGRQYLLT